MIDVGKSYFTCDECPISEGVEHRLDIAQKKGSTPQLEYCGCDKIQSEFYIGGYCEDAHEAKPQSVKRGKRRKGYVYRKEMEEKHRKNLTDIINNCGYNPCVGHIEWNWVDGVWQQVGKYIKYPKNSNAQQYWKRHSNKIVRRRNEIYHGNQYRKCFDYWWTLY